MLAAGVLKEENREQLATFYQALDRSNCCVSSLAGRLWGAGPTHIKIGQVRLAQMPSVRLLESSTPEVSQAEKTKAQDQVGEVFGSTGLLVEIQPRQKRKYRRSEKPRVPHTGRTRKDPLEEVWPDVQPWGQTEPERTAQSLVLELQSQYPGPFPDVQLRTLQRRVQPWRRETLGSFQTKGLNPELEPWTIDPDSPPLNSVHNGSQP